MVREDVEIVASETFRRCLESFLAFRGVDANWRKVRELVCGQGEIIGGRTHRFIFRPAMVIGVAFLVCGPVEVIMVKDIDD